MSGKVLNCGHAGEAAPTPDRKRSPVPSQGRSACVPAPRCAAGAGPACGARRDARALCADPSPIPRGSHHMGEAAGHWAALPALPASTALDGPRDMHRQDTASAELAPATHRTLHNPRHHGRGQGTDLCSVMHTPETRAAGHPLLSLSDLVFRAVGFKRVALVWTVNSAFLVKGEPECLH